MAQSTDDKTASAQNPNDGESFVHDECGDYMWEEALNHFEKSEQHKLTEQNKSISREGGDEAESEKKETSS
jgi:hypothetical protein